MIPRGAPSLLLLLAAAVAPSSSSPSTLVDPAGTLAGLPLPPPPGGGGYVALLSSPGTPGVDLPFRIPSSDSVVVDGDVISAPGASLEESPASPLARGIGAAAAGSVASAVILTGVTLADVEAGIDGTRHGRTLAELFASAIRSGKAEGGPARLVVAVQGGEGDDASDLDADDVAGRVEEIFDAVAAALGSDDDMGNYFAVESAFVSGADGAAKVMESARAAARASAATPSPTSFAEAYRSLASAADDADPAPVAEAILACTDAYSRASRSCRARIAGWRHRVSRGLLVPRYGARAEALLARTLDLFDRDTMAAAGLPRAGERRLAIRRKLGDRTEGMLRRLFDDQMGILEKGTLRKFQAALLRRMDKDVNPAQFFESNAEALRTAAFAFESSASSLEVPSLSLTKSKAVQEANAKLNNALMMFPDSPAAKIKSMKNVERAVSKKKQPTEGSVSVALDVVAMIRPDGFGNLQGFAGYQVGPHSVTVGVHNDADDPGVVSQFGGVRPPFLRVQPKLKLDVEL